MRFRGRVRASIAAACVACGAWAGQAIAGPNYDFTRIELEQTLADLLAWLPGEWSSYPQLHFENTVRMPAEGPHENWYRTFARIEAPQVGQHVFYGQINEGGREGPLVARTQILYTVEIDEARQVVLVRGQPPLNAEKYVNLQDRPEHWGEVRQRDPAAINCDFIWRRSGAQIVGVLDGRTEDRRKAGPGTCSYQYQAGVEFFADAEWVLGPDDLWLYDINKIGGRQFIGRVDRTHTRLFRSRPYVCSVRDAAGERQLPAYDRGFVGTARSTAQPVEFMLLRVLYPKADGRGLDDQLRLTMHATATPGVLAQATAVPLAQEIALTHGGVAVACRLAPRFPPLPVVAQP
jgi:hypothetical protein